MYSMRLLLTSSLVNHIIWCIKIKSLLRSYLNFKILLEMVAISPRVASMCKNCTLDKISYV